MRRKYQSVFKYRLFTLINYFGRAKVYNYSLESAPGAENMHIAEENGKLGQSGVCMSYHRYHYINLTAKFFGDCQNHSLICHHLAIHIVYCKKVVSNAVCPP